MKYQEAKPFLKEGMKVKITHATDSPNCCGITIIDGKPDAIVKRECPCRSGHWLREGDELEILENSDGTKWIDPRQREFKVGDRVRITHALAKMDEPYVGRETEITRHYNTDFWYLNGISFVFKEEQLELVEELEIKESGVYKLPSEKEYLKTINELIESIPEGVKLTTTPSDYSVIVDYGFITKFNQPIKKERNFMSNIIEKIKDLRLTPVDRILRKHGFEDDCKNPTPQTREMMLDELADDRWKTRREEVAADLQKVEAEEDK